MQNSALDKQYKNRDDRCSSFLHITPCWITGHHCFCFFVMSVLKKKHLNGLHKSIFHGSLLESLVMAHKSFFITGTCEVPLSWGSQVSIETSLCIETPWVISGCWATKRSGKFNPSVCENATSHSPHRSITWLTLWLMNLNHFWTTIKVWNSRHALIGVQLSSRCASGQTVAGVDHLQPLLAS